MATAVKRKVATLVTDSSQRLGDDAEMRFYVREWRKYRGLNQEQLGARIGMSKSGVSKMEKGKSEGGRQSAAKHQGDIETALVIEEGGLRRKPPEGWAPLSVNELSTNPKQNRQREPKLPVAHAEGGAVTEDEDFDAWEQYLLLPPRAKAKIRREIGLLARMKAKKAGNP